MMTGANETPEEKKPQVIWANKVDGKYDVIVERKDDYKGTLLVKLDDKVLDSKEVTLSFAAMFGPDVTDVNAWADWCVEVVDKHIAESKSQG